MSRAQRAIHRAYSTVTAAVTGDRARRYGAPFLLATFLGSLLVIELASRGWLGWLPYDLHERISHNHFEAIALVFDLMLIGEIVALVLGLADSVSLSAGKQIEVFSLILLRKTFKHLTDVQEPLTWAGLEPVVPQMVASAGGALVMFALLAFYYRWLKRRVTIHDESERDSFIAAKQLISLSLLVLMVLLALEDGRRILAEGTPYPFFSTFFELLIFSDILIVLASIRYVWEYTSVFRYFGFAVATLLIRLALVAPPYIDAALGVGATLFAIGLAVTYNIPERRPGARVQEELPGSHQVSEGDAGKG
jgi:hypothetical protein